MVEKLLISMFLFQFIFPSATVGKQVEIFDNEKGKVVQVVPLDKEVQENVEACLDKISGVFSKLNPIPNKGLMVKVPLEQSYMMENQWLHTLINEVIIILPQKEDPYLLVFDDENSPHFFTFKGNIKTLLNKLDLKK